MPFKADTSSSSVVSTPTVLLAVRFIDATCPDAHVDHVELLFEFIERPATAVPLVEFVLNLIFILV